MVFNRPSIPTVKHQHSLLDCRRRAADRVIANMRDQGQALDVSYEKSGDLWWLSDGTRVPAETAKLVIVNPDIVSTGDALFGNVAGQTFRVVK